MGEANILVVEDEALVALSLQRKLRNLGYRVCGVVDAGEAAVQQAEELRPDLVLMDIMLAGEMNGTAAAEQIWSRFKIPVVYLTALSDEQTLQRAKIAEPFGYLLKPFEDRDLRAAIEVALYKHQMERKLMERENWLSTTLTSIGDAVIAADVHGRVTFMNPVAEELTGWRTEEALGKSVTQVFNIVNEETRIPASNPVTQATLEGVVMGLSNHTLLIAKDGTEKPIDDSAAPIEDAQGNIIGVVLVFRDVTERKRSEQQIRASLREKEILLKEIYHRVKNNLQVISSLLNLQSARVLDQEAVKAFRESQQRVRSIALIHEKLYQSDNLAQVNLANYIRDLAAFAFQSLDSTQGAIRLIVQAENIFFNIDTAIPCGLILNELISNALKHAFPGGRRGELRIELFQSPDRRFTLVVSDNGIGIPADIDPRCTDTLGLQLVMSLVDQLRGTLDVYRDGGTTFKITFSDVQPHISEGATT
jgi:PAS domain S-box-containing protein